MAGTWSRTPGPGRSSSSRRADDDAGRAAIEGWLTDEAGRALFTQAGLDYEELDGARPPGRDSRPSPWASRSMRQLHNSIRRFNSANVIALLPGGERKHEYVLYSAHWDRLGRDAGGAIFNGAVDNASGVAGLLMLAQSFSRTQPAARSIDRVHRVHRRGSRAARLAYYVEHPVFPLGQTAGGAQSGRPARRRTHARCHGVRRRQFGARGVRARGGAFAGPGRASGPPPGAGLYYRSDQLSFALHGVPALYVKSGHRRHGARPGMGPGAARGLHGAPLSPTERQIFGGLGRARRGRGSDALLRSRLAAGEHPPLSALVSEQRIQRAAAAAIERPRAIDWAPSAALALADSLPVLPAVEAAGGVVGIEAARIIRATWRACAVARGEPAQRSEPSARLAPARNSRTPKLNFGSRSSPELVDRSPSSSLSKNSPSCRLFVMWLVERHVPKLRQTPIREIAKL